MIWLLFILNLAHAESFPLILAQMNANAQCGDIKSFVADLPFDFRRHDCVLAKPYLVTGASVSTGKWGVSPIDVLKHGHPDLGEETNIAAASSKSSHAISRIRDADPDEVSAIFALDLFFWDAQRSAGGCSDSVKNAQTLLNKASEMQVIVGNVPQTNPCAQAINRTLDRCRDLPGCTLIDLASLQRKLEKEGCLKVEATCFTEKELRPDGLHFGATGAQVFAEEILKAMDAKPPRCAQGE